MGDMTVSIPFRPCKVLYKTSRRQLPMKLNGYPQVLLTSWGLSSRPNRAQSFLHLETEMTNDSILWLSILLLEADILLEDYILQLQVLVLEVKMINDSTCEYQSRRNYHGPHGLVVHLQILNPRNHQTALLGLHPGLQQQKTRQKTIQPYPIPVLLANNKQLLPHITPNQLQQLAH